MHSWAGRLLVHVVGRQIAEHDLVAQLLAAAAGNLDVTDSQVKAPLAEAADHQLGVHQAASIRDALAASQAASAARQDASACCLVVAAHVASSEDQKPAEAVASTHLAVGVHLEVHLAAHRGASFPASAASAASAGHLFAPFVARLAAEEPSQGA